MAWAPRRRAGPHARAQPDVGTDLDAVLRDLGVTTIIATGVSVNIAITDLVIKAVNLGYDVVVPRDAVWGVPADADAVIDNALRCWRPSPPSTSWSALWKDGQ